MLKTSYTDHDKELKMWVDPTDGSLNVQVGSDTDAVKVPYPLATEMLGIMRNKQQVFQEKERRKLSFWSRLFNSFNFDNPEEKYSYETV